MNHEDETYPEICAVLSQVCFSEHNVVVGNELKLEYCWWLQMIILITTGNDYINE